MRREGIGEFAVTGEAVEDDRLVIARSVGEDCECVRMGVAIVNLQGQTRLTQIGRASCRERV